MKYLIAIFLFLFTYSSSCVFAASKLDSVYVSVFYGGIKDGLGADSLLMFGKPDKKFTKIAGNAVDITVGIRKNNSSQLQLIKGNDTKNPAKILIWGRKDPSVDSSSCEITMWYDDGIGTVYSSPPIVFSDTVNLLTIPNNLYNYIEITLPQDPTGSGKGSKSYFIDAIAIVEDTTPVSSVGNDPAFTESLASYPNPFSGSTTIHYSLEAEGNAEIIITDLLGKEEERISAGYQNSGSHDLPVSFRKQGMYFIRLFLNGKPSGTIAKIISQ